MPKVIATTTIKFYHFFEAESAEKGRDQLRDYHSELEALLSKSVNLGNCTPKVKSKAKFVYEAPQDAAIDYIRLLV
jgi:hypothetical protein